MDEQLCAECGARWMQQWVISALVEPSLPLDIQLFAYIYDKHYIEKVHEVVISVMGDLD